MGGVFLSIQHQVIGHQSQAFYLARSSGHSEYPSPQFIKGKWLGHIVVGSVIQKRHLLFYLLMNSQKYDWCLFIGHLVIEKVLKAFYVRDTQKTPPWVHNLARLAESTKLSLTEEQLTFLADINDFNIETRYPDYKFSFYKTCTREFSEEQLSKIKEMYLWLLSQMKS